MATDTKTREPETDTTHIADVVVAKTAGIAATEVDGVYSLGSGMSQAVGAVRKRVPGGGSDLTSGVKVEVGKRQTAIDLDLVVEYGLKINDVAEAARGAVRNAVERGTGLEVVTVNIDVLDVHTEQEGGDRESGRQSNERQLA